MTREEAIAILKAHIECNKIWVSGKSECNTEECKNCKLTYEKGNMREQRECFELAIRSIEAWEKVKTKIKEAQSSIFCTEDENTGLEVALILIDNQISEVEHGSHSM